MKEIVISTFERSSNTIESHSIDDSRFVRVKLDKDAMDPVEKEYLKYLKTLGSYTKSFLNTDKIKSTIPEYVSILGINSFRNDSSLALITSDFYKVEYETSDWALEVFSNINLDTNTIFKVYENDSYIMLAPNINSIHEYYKSNIEKGHDIIHFKITSNKDEYDLYNLNNELLDDSYIMLTNIAGINFSHISHPGIFRKCQLSGVRGIEILDLTRRIIDRSEIYARLNTTDSLLMKTLDDFKIGNERYEFPLFELYDKIIKIRKLQGVAGSNFNFINGMELVIK